MTERRTFWTLVLSAGAIMTVTMGIRQSLGLFVSPLNTATGLGIVTVSFALAVGQFAWGVAQPLFGALADRVGAVKVIAAGAIMIALGLALTPFMHGSVGLVFFLGGIGLVGPLLVIPLMVLFGRLSRRRST